MKSKAQGAGVSGAKIAVAVAAACLVFAIMQGIHDNYGIMIGGLEARTGLDYAAISLTIAVGQILYGATQPLFGMLALKRSNAFVMMLGILLMAAGLILTPFCRALWSLMLCFGILLPSGTGALCFGIVMGAISPIIGERRAAMVSGIVQASAGVGDALMSPGLQRLIAWKGVATAMIAFSVPILAMIPVVIWLGRSRVPEAAPEERREGKLSAILRDAAKDADCRRLLVGFSTCGFHMAIIETHLFNQYVDSGIPADLASLAMTVYGVTTMLGAMLTGFMGMKFRMKNVLGTVYAGRIAIALGFLLLPKTPAFAFAATALLGLSGDSTVPPTTGIISRKVGVARMAIVYGAIFIGHQMGAFASAWLGGWLAGGTLGYAGLWMADLALSAAAAFASFRIRD